MVHWFIWGDYRRGSSIVSRGLTTDIFIGCGVAGAIAAGFGAPLAAIIFAHEAIPDIFLLEQ